MRHARAASAATACLLAACGTMPTDPSQDVPLRRGAVAHALGGGEVMFNPQPDPPRLAPVYPVTVNPATVTPVRTLGTSSLGTIGGSGVGAKVGFDPQPDPPIVIQR
jgi:hypothetical protein